MKAPDLSYVHYFRVTVRKVVHERHCHDWDELVVMCEGVYHGWRGNSHFPATAGDVILYRAGEAHEEENDLDKPGGCFVVSFHWDSLPPEFPYLVHDTDGRIRQLTRWLYEQFSWNSRCADVHHSGTLMAILGEFARLSLSGEERFVADVRRYVSDHLDQPISMERLAAAVHLSKNYLHRKYRRASGMTPMEEVRRMRIAKATLLLQTTRLPVKSVAAQVGLSDEFSLSHILRKYAGTSPSEIRRGKEPARAQSGRKG